MCKENILYDKEKEIKGKSYEVKKEMDFILGIDDSIKEKVINSMSSVLSLTKAEVIKKNQHISPKRGDIWLVDLGINIGEEMNNRRPCIVVSYNEYNNNSGNATLIPITRAECNYSTQFVIDVSCVNYVYKDIIGTVKAEQITTKSKSRFHEKIGELNEKGLNKLAIAMINHLCLSDYCADSVKNLCNDNKDSDINVKLGSSNEDEILEIEESSMDSYINNERIPEGVEL